MIREISKVALIRLCKPEDVKDAQDFILYLGEENLLGDIPVVLYFDSTDYMLELSHIYDVSENALIPLYEKFGEKNVSFRDKADTLDSVGLVLELSRIADALERIQRSMEILEKISDCISSSRYGDRFCITGDVTAYEP